MKIKLYIIIGFISICSVGRSQDVIFKPDSVWAELIKKDKPFNSAEDNVKTFSGYDVDITKPGEINFGLQVAQDVMKMTANSKDMLGDIANNSYYKQRVDLMFSAALPERTNVYTILSFVAPNSSTVNMAIVNLEIEHWFPGNHVKFRVGRLINKLSESQFFSRIALGEKAAHVFGRSPFENDAFELDINLKDKNLPVFFMGMKNRYSPYNIAGLYTGFHHRFKQKTQVYFVASAMRQFEDELEIAFPGYTGSKRWFYSYEMELAYRERTYSVFANLGGYINYIGQMPHSTGKYDLLRLYSPVVTEKKEALKETFIPSVGFRLRPAKMTPSLKFIPMMGVEGEFLGSLTREMKALNVYAYVKLNVTNRLVFTYSCNPQFIWNNRQDSELPAFLGGTANYFRLSLTLGKPTRMMI